MYVHVQYVQIFILPKLTLVLIIISVIINRYIAAKKKKKNRETITEKHL